LILRAKDHVEIRGDEQGFDDINGFLATVGGDVGCAGADQNQPIDPAKFLVCNDTEQKFISLTWRLEADPRTGPSLSRLIGEETEQVNLVHARLWVSRLKNLLSVEHPIAGDELRAIKRYLATRSDKLPWLFVSERGQPLTRQAVNYLIGAAAESAGLKHVHPARIYEPSRTTLGIAILGTPSTTRGCQEEGLRALGVHFL